MDNRERETLRLYILEESRNDAEAIANVLRDGGLSVRYQYAPSLDELDRLLAQDPADMIVCATGLAGAPLPEVRALLQAREIERPLIAIGDQADEPQVIEALQLGATDLVSFDRPQHLQLVVQREWRNLNLLAAVEQLQCCRLESERRARVLLDSSRDAIAYVHDGMHVYANPSYLEMFGFDDLSEVEGTTILDMVASDEQARFKALLREHARNPEQDQAIEIRCLSPSQGEFPAQVELARASIDGEPCTQVIIRERSSADTEVQEKLKYLTKQDMVTGLYNRQYFLEELEIACHNARAGTTGSAVLLIGIDDFRALKERVGLGGTDLALADIARTLRDCCREEDIVARFGDNSFVVLCEAIGEEAVASLAEDIRGTAEAQIIEVGGKTLTYSLSIGISMVSEEVEDPTEVVANADVACEVARQAGGNRVHFHHPETDQTAGQERAEAWTTLVQEALEQGRFHLAYQPIVSLLGEQRENYEVLLRMRDPEGNEIPPRQFLPSAIAKGQMPAIDRHILTMAMALLAERRAQGQDTVFFLKIAGATLDDEELAFWIRKQLQTLRLEGDALVFEIAEADAAQHLKRAKLFIQAMQALHCGVALEHFGRSPNSFQLLKHLPVDYIKIDGSFIHNLGSDRDNQAMVKSIVDVAHSMKRKCIAEFVEDASSLSVLFQQGVHLIQGYFLQPPMNEPLYDFSEESA